VLLSTLTNRNVISNYIEGDGYITPLTIKEAIQTFQIRRQTEHELRTCVVNVHLTSHLPWNPEEINDQDITSIEYDALISRELCSLQ